MATKRKMSGMRSAEGTRGGFTIIEVVLVLAIAGLIFLMVFIALPALQRSQRDTQRRQDLAKVTEAVTQFQTNNSGRLPGDAAKIVAFDGSDGLALDDTCTNQTAGSNDACKLIRNYLNGVNASENEFAGPDGWAYGMQVVTYTGDTDVTLQEATGSSYTDGDFDRTVYIIKHVRCGDEGSVRHSTNSRDFAVMMKLEGSGYYCQDNGS